MTMASDNSDTVVQDNLDLYLNDVFEKECVFQIDEDEVKFIQTGIETLIQRIVDAAINQFWVQERNVGHPRSSESLSETFRKYRDDSCPSEILKVGSFYEGTKNNFPDEFDFIFLLYCSNSISSVQASTVTVEDQSRKIMFPIINALLELGNVTESNKLSLRYVDKTNERQIYFAKFLFVKGPAAKLQFVYRHVSRQPRYIHVDLVPAIRETGEVAKQVMEKLCCHEEFEKEINVTGSYIFVNGLTSNYSFTETEVRFLRTVLSKKHVKVYRIIKYLINGHGDDEKMKSYLQEDQAKHIACKLYTSYRIKTTIIHHHYECSDNDQVGLAACVLDVLDKMSKCKTIDNFPKLVFKVDSFKTYKTNVDTQGAFGPFFMMDMREYKMGALSNLQALIHDLRGMKQSSGKYDYERDKIKSSVTKMYLESLSS